MAATQRIRRALYVCLFLAVFAAVSNAQTENSSSISGTVVDSSGGVVPDAIVTIHDPVSRFAAHHFRPFPLALWEETCRSCYNELRSWPATRVSPRRLL